jgi:hypothetical protein
MANSLLGVRGPGLLSLFESSEQDVVVEDVPDVVLHLLEANALAVEGLGEEVLARVKSEASGVADSPDLDVSRVLRWFDARGVGAG